MKARVVKRASFLLLVLLLAALLQGRESHGWLEDRVVASPLLGVLSFVFGSLLHAASS